MIPDFAAKMWGRLAAIHNTSPGVNDMASIATLKPKSKTGTVHWFNECVERSQSEDFTEKAVITPGLANVMLGNNPMNRNLAERRVIEYARDMAAGRWTYNMEPIIVAKTGELNDGQHRLQAIIESNTPQLMMIAFGAERESRTTVDQGAARTSAHYLSMDGVKHAALSAGLVRIVMAYEATAGSAVKTNLTHAEVVARVKADKAVNEAAEFSEHTRKYARGMLTPSQIGALYYLFAELDENDATEFMTQVCVGENIKRGDPAFAVRQALAALEGEQRFGRIEIVMRGWVAFRQGRKLQLAKVLNTLPALV